MTSIHDFSMSPEIGRVPSSAVRLNDREERRFQNLAEESVMIDVHQHPFVLPEAMDRFIDFLRTNRYQWGFEAVRHGGWTTVTTSNVFGGLQNATEMSFVEYEDVAVEVGMMLSDVATQPGVIRVGHADEILSAKQSGEIGFMPTLEHLPIGNRLERIDQLYSQGVRISGITYNRKNFIGDGMYERNPGGLSEFGIEVIQRMNDVGMAIDLSHASTPTVIDTLEFSKSPAVFSHNAAYTLRPTRRTRKDEELKACAAQGGLVCITAVPNALSDDPKQDIECVLDHYDYMVNLIGVDHVGIGTDTIIGDHRMFQYYMLGRELKEMPAPYLNGLESPADGTNIIRGLIRRGHSDENIKKIVGGNALDFFRRVIT